MDIVIIVGVCFVVFWLFAEIIFLIAVSSAIKNARVVPGFKKTVKEAAEEMLKANSLSHVEIREGLKGEKSDARAVYISKVGQESHAVSVLAVTLHEVGRAITYHKEQALYQISMYLARFSRAALLIAIPGLLVGLIGKLELLTALCVWIYAASGLLLFVMHATDRTASRYAKEYLDTARFLDEEQRKACIHLMNVNDWSFIQFIFEPFIMIVVLLSSLIGRTVHGMKAGIMDRQD